LHVLGRRADGYHLLDSLIVFAETGDVLAATPASDISLRIDGPFAEMLAGEGDNLVLRAARGLRELSGVDAGAAITLTKNLPIASGIGGGSADAAAALRLLSSLWKVDPDRAALERLALKLGADVPVCLDSKPSFIGGVGEEIASAGAMPSASLLLVNPGIATPTPAVFKARKSGFSEAARWQLAPKDAHTLAEALRARRNDLTEAAITVTPAIRDVLQATAATRDCLLSRLSGSGATCFGLYATEADADAARAEMRQLHPDWWAVAAPLSA
jgi:4-diphosphocytidyl-2-C-methyl-D-erythritol kinase